MREIDKVRERESERKRMKKRKGEKDMRDLYTLGIC